MSFVLLFPLHHFLYEIFNRKLHQYVDGGLNSYNTRDYEELMNPKKYEEYIEPFAVLNLDELQAGFVVCLVPLVLSIVVFGFEWLPRVKDLIVFLFIFKTYFEVKILEQKAHCEFIKSPRFLTIRDCVLFHVEVPENHLQHLRRL